MVLTVDVGNTNIKLGGFEEEQLIFSAAIATQTQYTADDYACSLLRVFDLYQVLPAQVQGVILSSVVPPLLPVLKQALKRLIHRRVLTVGPGMKTGLFVRMENPGRLGSDFVCAAVGAAQFVKPPCVVFDLGTATTVTALDTSGALVGTAILPGMSISLQALSKQTAQLPLISPDRADSPLGKTTEEAMKAGILYGTACMIDGLYQRYRALLGDGTSLLLTGGNAPLILPYCQTSPRYEKDLILVGLRRIYEKNKG